MESDEKVILRDFKRALARAWAVNDENNWPIKLNSISHLFLKEFFRDFSRNLEEISGRGCSQDEMVRILGSPTKMFRSMDQVLRGMFMNRIPVQERRNIIFKLLRVIKSQKSGSLFNEDGKNFLYSGEEIKRLAEDSSWRKTGDGSSIIIHQCIGLLKAYVELLFFRMYEISQEIHGQYDYPGSENNLIIREFRNLQPNDLWEGIDYLPYDHIRIFTRYDSSIRVEFDIYNHMYQEGDNFPPHLVKWMVMADEQRLLDMAEIKNLIALIRGKIFALQKIIRDWDWRRICTRYAEICFYKLNDLKIRNNNPIGLPAEVRANIQNGEINERTEDVFNSDNSDKVIKLLHIML